jgi:2Fe-2S ferredoxin
MVKVTYIAFDGREQSVDAEAGISLMENAVANGVEGIDAICGGNAYCGTCRVYVDPAWQGATGERTEVEDPMLETVGEEDPSARLSCQIEVTDELDGLVVRLPEKQT